MSRLGCFLLSLCLFQGLAFADCNTDETCTPDEVAASASNPLASADQNQASAVINTTSFTEQKAKDVSSDPESYIKALHAQNETLKKQVSSLNKDVAMLKQKNHATATVSKKKEGQDSATQSLAHYLEGQVLNKDGKTFSLNHMAMISTVIFAIIFLLLLMRIKNKLSPNKMAPDTAIEGLDAIAGDDALDTQLDLAQAYLASDRVDDAKALLGSILRQGTSVQQAEARRLLQSLN
jgi:FimV-like protein